MKGLKKLALASAIIAASSSAVAMQAMDDESMSAATGQDGLTIRLDTNLSNLGIKYIDRDGLDGAAAASTAGGLLISPVGITTTGVQIDIDVGSDGTAGNGTLQIQVTTPNATTINLNNTKISVGDADATGSLIGNEVGGATPAAATNLKDILTFDATAQVVITGSATPSLTIQLGNEAQGAFIKSTSDIPSLTLTGLLINDTDGNATGTSGTTGANYGGGSIGLGKLVLNNIHAVNAIDVVAGGLRIDTAGTTIGEVGLENVQLGTVDLSTRANSIGDIYISGLTSSGVITVTGH